MTSTLRRDDIRLEGRVGEVFLVFLKLGLTSFGGPIAHLGYFREELVIRRKWLDEAGYADLVGLCQFLPGPASSQVGFALGLLRAGFGGAVAAWAAFTLPSAILLLAFATASGSLDGPVGHGLVHGLKLVAVSVVAQAVWGMARTLTPDATRSGIAVAAVLVVTLASSAFGQLAAIALGAMLGVLLCRTELQADRAHLPLKVGRRTGIACVIIFFVLLIVLPLIADATRWQAISLFDAFYRSGALVFGGGHVVLPLLQAEVVKTGWVSGDSFLAGYGAAQAMPGPLFTFAAYLGSQASLPPNGVLGGLIALVAIFMPGLLLLVGVLPFWNLLRRKRMVQAAMRGTNAAVVGILATALYSPVWTSAVLQPLDFAVAVAGFVALIAWRMPPWMVVVAMAAAGVWMTL